MTAHHSAIDRLLAGLRHPLTGVFLSLVLMLAGLDDVWDQVESRRHDFGTHHGIIVFGAFRLVTGIAEIVERGRTLAESAVRAEE